MLSEREHVSNRQVHETTIKSIPLHVSLQVAWEERVLANRTLDCHACFNDRSSVLS
jgi:hypothetical protein